jgi:hypothetical protein
MTYISIKMNKMSLFKHRSFLRKIFFIFESMYVDIGYLYSIRGIKFRVSGKISVTGNARTRTVHFKKGLVSNSSMKTKVDYSFHIIRTNTGCLGFSVWLFF